MTRASFAWLLIGCSSAPPPKTEAPVAPVAPADAAPVVPPDTGPPAAVLAAPAYVFKYRTADRAETWTLRHADGNALVVVESAQGKVEYTGTAIEGNALAIAVATSTAKLALDCKREKLAVSAVKCNDTKAKPIDVLNCYHPDFQTPMSFAPAPGIEYVVEPGCNGFRLAKP